MASLGAVELSLGPRAACRGWLVAVAPRSNAGADAGADMLAVADPGADDAGADAGADDARAGDRPADTLAAPDARATRDCAWVRARPRPCAATKDLT